MAKQANNNKEAKAPGAETPKEETLEEKVARLEQEKADALANAKAAEAKAEELSKELDSSKSKEVGAEKKVNGTFTAVDAEGDECTYKFKDSYIKVTARAGVVHKSQDLIDDFNGEEGKAQKAAAKFLQHLVDLEYQGIELVEGE
jgi:predicted Zn-ribbon and HTH transcriptional regulator